MPPLDLLRCYTFEPGIQKMILVTGFGPYKEEINASGELIASLKNELPGELSHLKSGLALEIISCDDTSRETEHLSLERQLKELLMIHKPEICLFTGQAPPYNKITIEKVAINSFMREIIDPNRPVGYWSNIPGLDSLKIELEENCIPAVYSFYAGQHLCNHILYSSLHFAEQGGHFHKSGFVHIPVLSVHTIKQHPSSPSMPLEVSRKSLGIVINHMVESSRHNNVLEPTADVSVEPGR